MQASMRRVTGLAKTKLSLKGTSTLSTSSAEDDGCGICDGRERKMLRWKKLYHVAECILMSLNKSQHDALRWSCPTDLKFPHWVRHADVGVRGPCFGGTLRRLFGLGRKVMNASGFKTRAAWGCWNVSFWQHRHRLGGSEITDKCFGLRPVVRGGS